MVETFWFWGSKTYQITYLQSNTMNHALYQCPPEQKASTVVILITLLPTTCILLILREHIGYSSLFYYDVLKLVCCLFFNFTFMWTHLKGGICGYFRFAIIIFFVNCEIQDRTLTVVLRWTTILLLYFKPVAHAAVLEHNDVEFWGPDIGRRHFGK